MQVTYYEKKSYILTHFSKPIYLFTAATAEEVCFEMCATFGDMYYTSPTFPHSYVIIWYIFIVMTIWPIMIMIYFRFFYTLNMVI